MKKITVTVINDLATDQRVYRTCSLLMEMGFQVTLIGRQLPDSMPIYRPYKTKRFKFLINRTPLFYIAFHVRLFFYLLFTHQDIFWANDLDTLLANTLVSWIKHKPLIYDSHELFTESTQLYKRNFIKNIWKVIENFCFPHVDTFITVSEPIAEYYNKKYKKPIYIIKNLPSRLSDNNKTAINNDKFTLVMQGNVNIRRGYEEAVLSLKNLDNVYLYIIGDGDAIDKLHEIISKEKLDDKVKLIPKLPYEEMMRFTNSADVGLCLENPNFLNSYYSLPNKIFEYIQAGIPIIATNLPEVKKIIDKYNVGIIIDELSPAEISNAVNKLKNDKNLYNKLQENTKIAALELSWENEKGKLIEILKKYQ
jgi:glycosyltransferase involved in cell wall biosynthesis